MLDSEEGAYKISGEQATMILMYLGREVQGSDNKSPWMDQKHPPLPSPTGTDNTR